MARKNGGSGGTNRKHHRTKRGTGRRSLFARGLKARPVMMEDLGTLRRRQTGSNYVEDLTDAA